MAQRQTRLVIKNNQVPNAPFSGATLLKGEAIVNTADGIMMFSGVTSSTPEWTPAGTGGNSTFFEVGSNLYDLKLRNRITKYEGQEGANLVGKFLSGTTNGFVLANISSISGVDTYVTGATYSNNTFVFTNNFGNSFDVLFNTVTGLTVNGTLSATTFNGGDANVTTINATGGTITTLGSTTINANQVNATGATITTLNSTTLNVTGTETVNNLTITGTGLYNTTATGSSATEIVNYGSLTAYTAANDIYVTGGTVSIPATNNTNSATIGLFYRNSLTPHTLPFQDTFVTGGTYNAGTLTLYKNNNTNFDISGLTSTDTYVTGFTYTPASNTFTIKQNQGQLDLTAQFNSVSGLSVSNLTSGRVVYVGTGGLLTDEAGFEYNDTTNTLSVSNIEAAGNIVVQGDLTVLGASVSAFTSQLYVEDPNVIFNYNPTGSTTVTSVNAGLTIQDGSGISGSSVQFDIIRLQNLTGLTATQVPDVTEYVTSTGYVNRGWITQLNDIVIRSTDTTDDGNTGSINGVRVLAEFDVLDGGQY